MITTLTEPNAPFITGGAASNNKVKTKYLKKISLKRLTADLKIYTDAGHKSNVVPDVMAHFFRSKKFNNWLINRIESNPDGAIIMEFKTAQTDAFKIKALKATIKELKQQIKESKNNGHRQNRKAAY